jgi:hypothetical protein
MLLREIIVAVSEDCMKPINAFCGQNAEVQDAG